MHDFLQRTIEDWVSNMYQSTIEAKLALQIPILPNHPNHRRQRSAKHAKSKAASVPNMPGHLDLVPPHSPTPRPQH